MKNIACKPNILLSAIAMPLCGRPFPLFIAFVQKHVKPGISTDFTLNVSVNSKISNAIASLCTLIMFL